LAGTTTGGLLPAVRLEAEKDHVVPQRGIAISALTLIIDKPLGLVATPAALSEWL
jgi:hypothetical protein